MRIIIVEGARGAGKTTFSNCLRDHIPYSNLIKLCGLPKSANEKEDVTHFYDSLMTYLISLSKFDITIVMDRSFLTEQVMSALYKDYSFVEEVLGYTNLLRKVCSKIDYILMKAPSDDKTLSERLQREKVKYYELDYKVEASRKEQDRYSNIFSNLERYGHTCHYITSDKPVEELVKEYLTDNKMFK